MLKAMWFDAVLGPRSRNAHVRNITQLSRQLATAPVSRAIQGLSLGGPFKNAGLLSFAALTWRSACMARVQSGQALSNKSALPSSDEIGAAVQFLANRPVTLPIGEQQDQPRPSGLRRIARLTSIDPILAAPLVSM